MVLYFGVGAYLGYPVRDTDVYGYPAHVLLCALGRAGLPYDERDPALCAARAIYSQYAPVGSPCHGVECGFSHGPRLLPWGLSTAARIQLGDGSDTPGAHPGC